MIEKTQAPLAFETNAEAWAEGQRLVQRLWGLRGLLFGTEPNHEEAEAEIAAFYGRIRVSEQHIWLAKFTAVMRPTPEMLVITLTALLACWGIVRTKDVRQLAVLAVGFDPLRLHRLMAFIYRRRGAAILFEIEKNELSPTKDFLEIFCDPISDVEADNFRKKVDETFPTTTRRKNFWKENGDDDDGGA
ncbi:MAG: hypothetical protein M5U26_23660 [Planctomycetota bacterium]|nr:hypothetical protein [Planctomycetota bacterium]